MVDDRSNTVRKGTQLNGIYEIDEPLASGGMGEVFRAHTIQTGDPVAIKLIRDELAEDESALALFRREASALHSIHHEAIVRYFVFSVDPILQRPYLAMEFVEGEPLSSILRAGRLELDQIMALKARLASGLAAAHARGIVHRDMSPDNILIPEGDFSRARIIDFGIAHSTKLNDATLIGSGFAGKYNYVSPEQLGLFGAHVTSRSDIYSFGLVLAHASRGSPIDMRGSQVEVIDKRQSVPDLAGVDPELRPLIAWMLQPDPDLRPTSMLEVANWSTSRASGRLEDTVIRPQAGPHDPSRPPNPLPFAPSHAAAAAKPLRKASGGRRMIFAVLSVSALSLLVGVGLYFLSPFWGEQQIGDGPLPSSPETAGPGARPPSGKPGESQPLPPTSGFDQGEWKRKRLLATLLKADLGECGALMPRQISADAAQLEAFGRDSQVFENFDRWFRDATGVEPDVLFRQLAPAQCPAVAFLSRSLGDGTGLPGVNVKKAVLGRDDILTGFISASHAVVELLIVDDEGRAYNVTARMRPGGNERTFAMRVQAGGGGTKALLVLAVGSDTPFSAFRKSDRGPAAEVFSDATAELAAHPEARSAAAYVQIE